VSWNVAGLRAADRKGPSGRDGHFRRFLSRSGAFAVGVQEVRARLDQLPRRLAAPRGFCFDLVAAERPGYSGVGLYTRGAPDRIERGLGRPEFDREGRLQIAELGPLVIANAYFPNGNGRERDNSRVPYKLAFYRALFRRLARYRRDGRPVLVMGDFNTAHREIDLARPRENRKTSGFLPEERAELDRWLRAGWVDTFRARHPGPGHYSWWSQRLGLRERNVGWRIDYVLACPLAARHVERAFIWRRVQGSDHCPVGVDLSPRVLQPV